LVARRDEDLAADPLDHDRSAASLIRVSSPRGRFGRDGRPPTCPFQTFYHHSHGAARPTQGDETIDAPASHMLLSDSAETFISFPGRIQTTFDLVNE